LQSGPSVASTSLNVPVSRSEQILLEKTVKVKVVKPTAAELASIRHDVATAADASRANLRHLEKLRQVRALSQPKPVPELTVKPGYDTFSRRVISCLETAARDLDAPHDDAQAAAGGVAQSALGNNTESQAVFREEICQNTGEIQRVRYVSKRGQLVPEIVSPFAAINARAARFSAQTSAGKLLADERTPRGTQWRVSGCMRRKVAEQVSVLYSAAIKKAHFGGLMVCGSVWTCPPCAAKVSERRKNEVVQATDMHKKQGGGLYLVTLTCSHKRDDDLGAWLKKFAAAKVKMREWRGYKNLKRDMGYLGDIRALEVTYGDANGWHPHEHGLWLTVKPLTARLLESMRRELFVLWRRACVAVGLPPPNRARGVDVRFMESSAEYVTKFGREPRWGAGSEMTKQHTKSGGPGVARMTPFDLLRRYHDGSSDGSHKRFGALFVQFAGAFFGKRQVIWSDGLKDLFGIEQQTDEEIALEESEDARELIRITGPQWKVVLHQKHDVRQIILERAESGGHRAVVAYLATLMHLDDVMLS
jgi:hypothetical protein